MLFLLYFRLYFVSGMRRGAAIIHVYSFICIHGIGNYGKGALFTARRRLVAMQIFLRSRVRHRGSESPVEL